MPIKGKLRKDVKSILGEKNFDKKSYEEGFREGFKKYNIKNMIEHVELSHDAVKESKKKVEELYLEPMREANKAFQDGKKYLNKEDYENASREFGVLMGIMLKWISWVTSKKKVRSEENAGTYRGKAASILENSGNKNLRELNKIKENISSLKGKTYLEHLIKDRMKELKEKFSEIEE